MFSTVWILRLLFLLQFVLCPVLFLSCETWPRDSCMQVQVDVGEGPLAVQLLGPVCLGPGTEPNKLMACSFWPPPMLRCLPSLPPPVTWLQPPAAALIALLPVSHSL